MILDRYLIKEITPNILLGLLVFTFVMLMNQILFFAETLITRGVDFSNIFLIIYYSLPALMVLTIPMSVLLGVLLGLGRLSGDSELTVMRASGISMYRILAPIFGLALACWMICVYLMNVAVPWGNYQLSRFMYQILTTNVTSELKPRTFYNRFPGRTLYIQDIPSKEQNWKGVFIFDESEPEKPKLILAREGTVKTQPDQNALQLQLKEGSWHEVDPTKPEDYTSVYFLQNVFPLPIPGKITGGDIPKGDRDQTISELRRSIQENQSKNLPTNYLEVEIYKKYAIPFACVVFAVLATALGVSSKKGGRSSAYAVSIGIILVYYIFLIGGERFGDAGSVSPWLAAWAGNMVLGVLGVILFFQTSSNTLSKVALGIRGLVFARSVKEAGPAEGGKRRVRVVIHVKRFPLHIFTLLDRYIVREFLKNMLLILVALVVIAELIVATQLVDDLFKHKVGVDVLLQYLKFNFPQWVFFVLPVAAMTTTLITFGALTRNSEVIAMRSSGISLYRISTPVIVVGIALSAFAFWLQDHILPYTNKVANRYKDQIKGETAQANSALERHWISGSDGFYNYDLFDLRKKTMYGFSIYQLDLTSFSLQKRIYAREARFQGDQWLLRQGWERTFQRGNTKFALFKAEKIKLPVNPDYFISEQELPSEMTFGELQTYIQKIRERGFDFVRFAVDLQAKLSFPTVSLILTLIAIPFSFTTGKRGALYGIGISIVMGIIFWFFLALTKSLGYLEILNPFLAAWTPNILASLFALYLLFKLRT
ncbi:MAG TPA: LPS export ABC transporter permease LptG [Acidobacteriota bacterium]|nr:LPS export ABC transporter permease LptG [Acidobacteriota bacterium]